MRRAKPRSHRHPCEMPLFLVSVFPVLTDLCHTLILLASVLTSVNKPKEKKEGEKKERRKGRKKENTKKKIKHVGRHENLTRGPQLRWVPIDKPTKSFVGRTQDPQPGSLLGNMTQEFTDPIVGN